MTAARRPRAGGPPAGRLQLLAAARHLVAAHGPDVSVRLIAEAAGCTHTLVNQHFGSKQGLIDAVADQLGHDVDLLVGTLGRTGWSLTDLIAAVRADPDLGRLLVRCMLGELDDRPITAGRTLAAGLAVDIERRRGGGEHPPGPTTLVAAYALSAMLFGLLTFEGLLAAGSQAESIPAPIIDAAFGEAGRLVMASVLADDPDLAFGPIERVPRALPEPADLTRIDSRRALLEAVTDLFARSGPATLSTRSIAERAGVKQALIYHYFASREELIAVAINEANRPLQQTAAMHQPLDLVATIAAHHQLPSLRIIARVLANGVDIREVRNDFPVFRRLLALYDRVPDGEATDGLADPRLAVFVAAALGQGIGLWDDLLRRCLDIPVTVDLDTPMARIAERILAHAGARF